MNFKFFQGKTNLFLQLEPTQVLSLRPYRFQPDNVEFCFQFDNEEPTVFANGTEEMSLRIEPTSGSNITFTANDKQFTIFARERQ
jgi:hypothetical protein